MRLVGFEPGQHIIPYITIFNILVLCPYDAQLNKTIIYKLQNIFFIIEHNLITNKIVIFKNYGKF